MSDSNVSFWVDHILNQVPSKQIKSQLYNLKQFVIQKLKILDVHFNCLWGVLKNRPSIWRNFTCWIFRIIGIPSMKQNNAHFGLFVGFPKFGGITESCRIFLKGNETFQLFFEGVVELWIIIPLIKPIFENPKYVKSRQKRVISVEISTLKSQ